jgi:hypothetical protein
MSRFESWRQDEQNKVLTAAAPCCNACLKPAGSRVEVKTDTARSVLCAACAVALAMECLTRRERCVVSAFTPPAISIFVASDNFYSPNCADVRAHQALLDERAQSFAARIKRVIERAAESQPVRRIA